MSSSSRPSLNVTAGQVYSGAQYGLVNVHTMQPASNLFLFTDTFYVNQSGDHKPLPKVNPPQSWGGEIQLTYNGSEIYGHATVLYDFVTKLRNTIVAHTTEVIPFLNLNDTKSFAASLKKIVDQVNYTFADYAIYLTGKVSTPETRIDIQAFYDSFQAIVKDTTANAIMYGMLHLDMNWDWIALAKSKRKLITRKSGYAASRTPDVLETALNSLGIEYTRASNEIFIVDGNTDINLVMVGTPDLQVSSNQSYGQYVELLEELGLL